MRLTSSTLSATVKASEAHLRQCDAAHIEGLTHRYAATAHVTLCSRCTQTVDHSANTTSHAAEPAEYSNVVLRNC